MTRADLPLLKGWLAQPHVALWWGDPDRELAMIEQDIDGGPTDMRIVCADAPFAFVQDYDVRAYSMPQYDDLPEGARGIDTFLGDPAWLGRGHGAAYLRQRARQLLDKGAPVVAVDPDPANTRAIAAYRKAGFAGDRIACGEDGDPVLVLTCSPSSG